MAGLVTGAALHDAKVVFGLRNTLEATADIIGSAERSLTGEAFILYADNAVHTALGKVRPDLDALFLTDPEMAAKGSIARAVLDDMGAKVVQHGEMPNKIHAKSLVADGDRGIVSTGAWYTDGGYRDEWLDLAVHVRGDAARAVENLTRTAAAADQPAFAKAAHEAAQHGVYINDPSMGVMELGTQIRHMIDSATERLVIATKRTDSPEVEGMLQAARDRGVEVTRYDRGATGKTLHGNVIVADDHAYIGSGMLNNRTLKGSGSSGRMARELGVVIDGPAVDDVVKHVTTRIEDAAAAKAAKDAAKAAEAAGDGAVVADAVVPDAVVAEAARPRISRRTLAMAGGGTVAAGGATAGYLALRR